MHQDLWLKLQKEIPFMYWPRSPVRWKWLWRTEWPSWTLHGQTLYVDCLLHCLPRFPSQLRYNVTSSSSIKLKNFRFVLFWFSFSPIFAELSNLIVGAFEFSWRPKGRGVTVIVGNFVWHFITRGFNKIVPGKMWQLEKERSRGWWKVDRKWRRRHFTLRKQTESSEK